MKKKEPAKDNYVMFKNRMREIEEKKMSEYKTYLKKRNEERRLLKNETSKAKGTN
jgi:type III secretory pathway component EscR